MKPRYLLFLFLLVGGAGHLLAENPDPSKPGRELRVLFSYVEGADDELRDRAIKRLLTLGPPVVPFIKLRLKTRAAEHYRYVLSRIEERARLRTTQKANSARQLETLRLQRMMRKNWERFIIAYLKRKLERIEDLGRQERYSAAIDLIDALRLVEPGMPGKLQLRLKALRKTFKSRRFAATAIQGEVEVDKRIYVWKERIQLTFVVTNNSAQEYVIRSKIQIKDPQNMSKLAEHHSVIRIKYKVFDYHVDGRKLGREQDIDLRLTSDITLGKDQKWRRVWRLPDTRWPGEGYIYREIEIDARAIPVGMKAPAARHDQTKILFPLQRFKVYPKNYQNLADRPLVYLASLLRDQRPRDAFVAGLLVSQNQRKAAIDLLIKSLGKHNSETTRTTFALLKRLSGKRMSADAERWKLWWMANKERFKPPGK